MYERRIRRVEPKESANYVSSFKGPFIYILIIQHDETPLILYSRRTCEDAMELGLEVCSIGVQILFQQIGDSVAWNP